jgi:hypothetical protein
LTFDAILEIKDTILKRKFKKIGIYMRIKKIIEKLNQKLKIERLDVKKEEEKIKQFLEK